MSTGLVEDFQRREAKAVALLGNYSIKTAGALLLSSQRASVDGWLYANSREFLFLSDTPIGGLFRGRPERFDEFTLLFQHQGRPVQLTAPRFVPNGIINFGNGLEFVGAKKRIKAIAKAAQS